MEEEEKKLTLRPAQNSKKKLILIIVIIAIVVVVVLYTLFKIMAPYKGCETWECFNENIAACDKAKFAGGKEILFGYTIEGPEDDKCKIVVEYLQGDIANKNAKQLLGKKMTCYTPKGIIMLPESDLSNCHGELKEKLQEQIISELHSYIIQNLGEINKAILNPLLQQKEE